MCGRDPVSRESCRVHPTPDDKYTQPDRIPTSQDPDKPQRIPTTAYVKPLASISTSQKGGQWQGRILLDKSQVSSLSTKGQTAMRLASSSGPAAEQKTFLNQVFPHWTAFPKAQRLPAAAVFLSPPLSWNQLAAQCKATATCYWPLLIVVMIGTAHALPDLQSVYWP